MPPSSALPAASPFLLLFSQDEYRADLRAILREELRQVLREELAAQVTQPATAARPDRPPVVALLSVKEAAAFLDVCVASIHAWKRRGLLPYRKLGSRTLFTTEDLQAALQQPPRLDGRRTTPRRGRVVVKPK
jgi:Helix-turn-helix domain